MSIASCNIPVRYSELSPSGYVYHGHYPEWFEYLLNVFLSKNGFSLTKLSKAGVNFMPYEIASKYYRPIELSDDVRIDMSIRSVSMMKIEIEYCVFANDKKAVSSKTVYACLGNDLKPLVPIKACPGLYELMKNSIE